MYCMKDSISKLDDPFVLTENDVLLQKATLNNAIRDNVDTRVDLYLLKTKDNEYRVEEINAWLRPNGERCLHIINSFNSEESSTNYFYRQVGFFLCNGGEFVKETKYKIEWPEFSSECSTLDEVERIIDLAKNLDEDQDIQIIVYEKINDGWKEIRQIDRAAKGHNPVCPNCGIELEFDKNLGEFVCTECDYRLDD